jgi:hypothetical protein
MRKKGKSKDNGATPLAILSEEDRIEYVRRKALVDHAGMQFQAAANYLDMMNQQLVQKYELPPKFDLELDSGFIREATSGEAIGV